MKMKINRQFLADHPGRQKGASLVEIIAYLGVAGMVIGGALAMYMAATSSQGGNQLVADISGVRTAVRSLWSSTANFGTANMLPTLETASRLPSTWSTTGAGAAMTARHQLSAGVGVVGQTSTFALTFDGIPTDVCTALVTQQGSQGWINVFIAASPGNVTPLVAGALTDFGPTAVGISCSGGAKKITLVSR